MREASKSSGAADGEGTGDTRSPSPRPRPSKQLEQALEQADLLLLRGYLTLNLSGVFTPAEETRERPKNWQYEDAT